MRNIYVTVKYNMASAPGAPTGLNPTAVTSTGLTLTWAAPSSKGNKSAGVAETAALTYTIKYSTDESMNTGVVTLPSSGSITALTYAISGLSASTMYYYRVWANNSVLQSTTYASGSSLLPAAVGSPSNLTAVATVSSIALSWTAPTTTGGLTVNYRIERSTDNSNWFSLVATQTQTSFTNITLSAGTNYWYKVYASNATGDPAAISIATNTVPSAPTGVAVAADSNTSVRVTFTPPSVGNTSKTYNVYNASTNAILVSGATASPVIVSDLSNGLTYTFKVATVSAAGTSAFSSNTAPFIVAMVPDQVTNVVATPISTSQVTVSWSAPASNNGATMTYKLEKSDVSGIVWTTVSGAGALSASTLSYTATSLSANTCVLFKVSANNVRGAGPVSSTVLSAPLPSAAPTVAVTGANTANVTFIAVKDVSYRIVPFLGGVAQTATPAVLALSNGSNMVSVTVDNPCRSYTFKVQIYNSDGSAGALGAASATAYLGSSVAAPSGKAYNYTGASFVVGAGTVSYMDISFGDASCALTTVGGGPAWSVTAGGQTDTLIGVKCVVFRDRSAFLFGSGGASMPATGGNLTGIDTASATNTGARNGDKILFAGGETYIRSVVWQIICGVELVGIKNAANVLPTLQINNASFGLFILNNNVTLTDLIINGGTTIRSGSGGTIVKCTSYYNKTTLQTPPLELLTGISFKNVTIVNTSNSRSIDLHYVSDVTIDGCNFGASSTDTTFGLTSCKNITMKNSTIDSSGGSTMLIGVTDGPNYVWNTSTSPLFTADDAAKLAAFQNTNLDFTENNTFSANPLIYIDLYRVTNKNGAGEFYDVTMSYGLAGSQDLKLPANFQVAYSGLNTVYAGFNYPVSRIVQNTAYSSTALRSLQWSAQYYPTVTVNDISTDQRIYPDGYATLPAAPSKPSTTPQNKSITVAWTAPAAYDDVAGIMNYNIYWTDASGAAQTATVGGSTLSYQVQNLVAGRDYTFQVSAVNGLAEGARSPASDPAQPNPVPGPPQNVLADVSNGFVRLSWDNPSNFGGDYLVICDDLNGDIRIIDGIEATHQLINGLTNGTEYSISIQAESPAGLGEAALLSIMPRGLPGQPGKPATTNHKDSITVQWTAAAANGDTPTYRVTCTGTDGSSKVSSPTSALHQEILDLSSAVFYQFTVTATNAAGAGPISDQSEPAQPLTAPPAPTNLDVSAGDAQLTIAWTAPTLVEPVDASENIVDYTVKVTNGSVVNTYPNILLADLPYVLTGLTNGTNYSVSVRARCSDISIGDNGQGEEANPVSVTPLGTPAAPGVVADASNGRVTVVITRPDDGSNGANTSLTYTIYRNGSLLVTQSDLAYTNYTDTDVSNGSHYSYIVTASNALFTSELSSASSAIPLGIPDAPTVVVTADISKNIVVVGRPNNDGSNGADTSLTYAIYRDTSLLLATQTGLTYTDSNVSNGTSYSYTVTARNALFISSASSASSATPLAPVTSVSLLESLSNITSSSSSAEADQAAKEEAANNFIKTIIATPAPPAGQGSLAAAAPAAARAATGLLATIKNIDATVRAAAPVGQSAAVTTAKVRSAKAAAKNATNKAIIASYTASDPLNNVVVSNGSVKITLPGGNDDGTTGGLKTNIDFTSSNINTALPTTRAYPPYAVDPVQPSLYTSSYILTDEDAAVINSGTGYFGWSLNVSDVSNTYILNVSRTYTPPGQSSETMVTVALKYDGVRIIDGSSNVYGIGDSITIGDVKYIIKMLGSVTGWGIAETPTNPWALTATQTGNSIAITWNSEEGEGTSGQIDHFDISVNPVGAGTALSYTLARGSGFTAVKAVDGAGTPLLDLSSNEYYIITPSSAFINAVKRLPAGKYTFAVVTKTSLNRASSKITSAEFTVGGSVTCFLGNAPVLTPSGYRRMDSLAVGDLVQTPEGKAVAIQNVTHQYVVPGPTVNPYVIPKGLYGASETLAISPRHCVVIPGRGYVEARELGLKQMPMKTVFDYYNLELPAWENMVVAGVAVESLAPTKRIVIPAAAAKAFLEKKAREGSEQFRKAVALFKMDNGVLTAPLIQRGMSK